MAPSRFPEGRVAVATHARIDIVHAYAGIELCRSIWDTANVELDRILAGDAASGMTGSCIVSEGGLMAAINAGTGMSHTGEGA